MIGNMCLIYIYIYLSGLSARLVVKSGYPKDTCYDKIGATLRLYRHHFKYTKAFPPLDPR